MQRLKLSCQNAGLEDRTVTHIQNAYMAFADTIHIFKMLTALTSLISTKPYGVIIHQNCLNKTILTNVTPKDFVRNLIIFAFFFMYFTCVFILTLVMVVACIST